MGDVLAPAAPSRGGRASASLSVSLGRGLQDTWASAASRVYQETQGRIFSRRSLLVSARFLSIVKFSLSERYDRLQMQAANHKSTSAEFKFSFSSSFLTLSFFIIDLDNTLF